MPRTPEEILATAKRLRGKAASMRNLLADPGEGCEQFKIYGPEQAKFYETFATELEAVAHE